MARVNSMGWQWISGVAIALATALLHLPVQATPELETQAAEVVSYLVGQMDTAAQAATNEIPAAVRMTTCVIQVGDSEGSTRDAQGTYLYQEQALMDQLDQPYRQRFLQIVPHDLSQSVRSHSFKPLDAAAWVGLCDQPAANREIGRAHV